MLLYELENVAEVAGSGAESIKESASWRQIEPRTIVHSTMNSSSAATNNNNGDKAEKTLSTSNQSSNTNTDQANNKSNPSGTKKPKVKGKKSEKHTMIQCKTFVFKPSNNGVINFGFKGLFDEKVMKEADRVYEEEKAKKESEKKTDDVTANASANASAATDDVTDATAESGNPTDANAVSVHSGKSDNTFDNNNSASDYDDESDQRRRKQPAQSAATKMNNSKIIIESKDFDPVAIKEQQELQQEQDKQQKIQKDQQQQDKQQKEHQEPGEKQKEEPKKDQPTQESNDKQVASRPISVPRRRLKSASPSLPTITEETPEELAKAEQERWFFEDFCEGALPPPEELDDWSEPAVPAVPAPESKPLAPAPAPAEVELTDEEKKILREKILEVQKLGCKRVFDAQGNKTMLLTPEAKEKLLKTKEFREYVKKMRELEKIMGANNVEKLMKIEIIPSKAALESTTKKSSPLTSGSVTVDSVDTAVSEAPSSITPPQTSKTETSGYLSSVGVIETPMKAKPARKEEEKAKEEKLRKQKELEELRREKDVLSDEEAAQLAKRSSSRKQPLVDSGSFKRRRI